MEKTKAFYLVGVFAVSVLLLSTVNAQTIPEEARRHMARGQAAVEIAKSPDEYDSAINEFQQASRLAPDWPDPYFQLANLQEKTGKLKEAVASLKEYLRLAPNTHDASKLQEQIYKLEYKAEQMLTVPEIIDVLVSLSDEQKWQVTGDCKKDNIDKGAYKGSNFNWRGFNFEHEGYDAVTSLKDFQYDPPYPTFQTLNVIGPVLKYITTRNVSGGGSYKGKVTRKDPEYTAVLEHEVTVVSKRLVKVNQKVLREGTGNGVSTGDKFSCTFQKK